MTNENIKQRCDMLLTLMIGKDLVNDWWSSPNKAFNDEPPDVVFVLEPMKVYQYLIKYLDGYLNGQW